jgi:hypothetical protein
MTKIQQVLEENEKEFVHRYATIGNYQQAKDMYLSVQFRLIEAFKEMIGGISNTNTSDDIDDILYELSELGNINEIK